MTNPADFLRKSIQHNNSLLLNKKLAPNITKKPEYPCAICNCDVKHNDKSILCSSCDKWAHIRCTDVSVNEYREMQLRNRDNPELIENESWICLKCIMENRSEYNPFIFLSDTQLDNMNSIDSMLLYDMLPDDDVFSDALKTNSLTTIDDDEIDDNVDNINCKYYACDEFFTHDNSNSFNILHSNVNGLISHADNINEFLSHCESTNFDAICITETSLHQNADIPDNVLPNGYEHISTETLGT